MSGHSCALNRSARHLGFAYPVFHRAHTIWDATLVAPRLLCYMCIVMYATDRFLPAAKVCEAAGCKDVTFRAWRRRNGLFPELWDGSRTVNYFSILDTCMVRLIVVLTRHGLSADDAVSFVQGQDLMFGLKMYLGRMIDDGDGDEEIVGFSLSEELPPESKVLVAGEERVVASGELPPPRLTYFHEGAGRTTLSEAMRNNKGVATFVSLRAIVDHVIDKLGLSAETQMDG